MKIYQTLEVVVGDAVTTVTIHRPKALNALNLQVLQELDQVVTECMTMPNCRALVLTGSGDKAFVAGADIAAMKSMTPQEAGQFSRVGHIVTEKMNAAPFVSIAKVNGFALGGGCELAMACDILIAADTALFGQPEVDLGLIPGFGGSQRLVRRVGPALAMAMLVGGVKITGKEAFAAGLASQSVPREELDAAVAKILAGVLRGGPRAIAATKRLAYAASDVALAHGLAAEAESFALRFQDPEASDGMASFIEKRRPFFFSGV